MNIHDGTVTRTDRISMSAALYELAENLVFEGQMWGMGKPIQRDCQRQARILALVARSVLNPNYEYARAEAYYDAGAKILADEQAARRFFAALSKDGSRA